MVERYSDKVEAEGPIPSTRTTMFSKIDKKLLFICAGLLTLILLGGFLVFKYIARNEVNIKNVSNGIQTETAETPQNKAGEGEKQIQNQPAQIQGVKVEGDIGGLLVCADQCGDGICQAGQKECNNLNCICYEDKNECPQDCPDSR